MDTNVWNTIPLGDYEQHMQHADVGQAQLLNQLTGKYLRMYQPEYLLFLGVSGGNGLAHSEVAKAKRVCGIDINSAYLEQTRHRFGATIRQLDLVKADVNSATDTFINADFVWAALIFEYVDLAKCFAFIERNTRKSANLLVTLQANNGVASVSKTGIESVKAVASIFKLVDLEDLKSEAVRHGFKVLSVEENYLPNGKSLLTCAFSKVR